MIEVNNNGMTFSFTTAIKEFTRDDIKTGDIVTLRNGDKLMYVNEDLGFVDLDDENKNYLCELTDLNNDLTYNGDEKENDIMKLERPSTRITQFEREEETREMTLEEICKELGYNVKIVKEEE